MIQQQLWVWHESLYGSELNHYWLECPHGSRNRGHLRQLCAGDNPGVGNPEVVDFEVNLAVQNKKYRLMQLVLLPVPFPEYREKLRRNLSWPRRMVQSPKDCCGFPLCHLWHIRHR